MVWYSHLFQNFPQFVVIYTVKDFSVVNKAEVDIFLVFSCFFYDLMDVGNLISGSSAFSKSSLNSLKFMVHVLLKPGLETEHYLSTQALWVALSAITYILIRRKRREFSHRPAQTRRPYEDWQRLK